MLTGTPVERPILSLDQRSGEGGMLRTFHPDSLRTIATLARSFQFELSQRPILRRPPVFEFTTFTKVS
jgi:hypothetical protein